MNDSDWLVFEDDERYPLYQGDSDWIPEQPYEEPSGIELDRVLASIFLADKDVDFVTGDEVVVDVENVKDPKDLRAIRFATIYEALEWLFETGLIFINGKVTRGKNGEIGAAVPCNTPHCP